MQAGQEEEEERTSRGECVKEQGMGENGGGGGGSLGMGLGRVLISA